MRVVVVALLGVLLAGASRGQDEGLRAASAAGAVRTVSALTRCEGRGSGSAGGRAAADWLTRELAGLGLAPLGTDYRQPFSAGERSLANVVATIPGREPGEAVVLGAHYDHLGRGDPPGLASRAGQVHPGADDNASGSAALLEVARAFLATGQRPRRRVVFVWFDGEERGLLGSRALLARPPFPERIALMINLDMVGRLRGRPLPVFGVDSGEGLRDWARQAAEAAGLELDARQALHRNSDQQPFYEAGVPVLAPCTGLFLGYHRPEDTPERLDYPGVAQIARFCFGVAWRAAEAEAAPAFRGVPQDLPTLAREELRAWLRPAVWRGLALACGPTRLGAEAEPAPGGGLRLLRVARGGPAAAAGLRPGDVLLELEGRRLTSPDEVRRALDGARGHDLEVRWRRGERQLSGRVELPGRRGAPGEAGPQAR